MPDHPAGRQASDGTSPEGATNTSSLGGKAPIDQDPPVFDLYVDHSVIVTPDSKNIQQVARFLKFSQEYLDRVGLRYRVRYLPWTRIMREAGDGRNTLVNALIRTKERETEYIWLKKIESMDYYLIGDAALSVEDLKPINILKGNIVASCEFNTAQCGMLQTMGFPVNRVIQISNLILEKDIHLFNRLRTQVFILHQDDLQAAQRLPVWREGPEKAILMRFPDLDIYLAASRASLSKEAAALLTSIAEPD
ncbi:hypothetical protein GCM10017044_04770 [Kordiimonas sediminis]|uniref:Solute-binding protein family 3/N-terminal domain-containing protein n=2 Tax=Kordiimonas sediminis TaxID=1735581 RepID=A0A919AKA2_9PROT|nr:hypothetical protein GCM10017044_04770 [Kordiimonas sediminis]